MALGLVFESIVSTVCVYWKIICGMEFFWIENAMLLCSYKAGTELNIFWR